MQVAATKTARAKRKTGFFDLTDDGATHRSRRRFLAVMVLLIGSAAANSILSGIETSTDEQWQIITILGILKYWIVLFFIYFLARKQAAHYLDDIFELNNEPIAAAFIEEVAFGGKKQKITIDKGEISQEDQKSPIVLIGGPGKIQVNLDSVALLEKLDGEPEIIDAQDKPWELGCFERIREIGQEDEPGKREFAIINLRDQFVKDIKVVTRTKDGIKIYIEGVKAIFSIRRDPNSKTAAELEKNPFTFDKKAVHALVYKQHVLKRPYHPPSGVKFPWETTAVALIKLELEELMQSHPLSETFASMTQKEVDELLKKEAENQQMKHHLIQGQKGFDEKKPPPLTLIPRAIIRDHFFRPEFQKKAEELGIDIQWVDIGSWRLGDEFVPGKIKEARDLNAENQKRRAEVDRHHHKRILEELIELIKKVVVHNFHQEVDATNLKDAEWASLAEMIRTNPELSNDYTVEKLAQQKAKNAATTTIVKRMLADFRRELLAARDIIIAEGLSPIERDAQLRNINNALHSIDHYARPAH